MQVMNTIQVRVLHVKVLAHPPKYITRIIQDVYAQIPAEHTLRKTQMTAVVTAPLLTGF